MKQILVRNAFVVDPAHNTAKPADILVEDDYISRIGTALPVPVGADAEVIDAGGSVAVPGFIDLQVNPGFGIEAISRTLLGSGVTTPLVMPCNVNGQTYLQHYGGLKGVLAAAEGQYTNVATAVSIEPADTDLHETYKELRVPAGGAEARVREFAELGVTAVGEVVLPLAGTAHITSGLSEPFLDELLEATTKYNYPVLLHTGLGTDGVLRAIEIAAGRKLHICHVGSTVAGGELHRVLQAIADSPNITCDTHLAPMAGTNSRKSDLLQHYFAKGEAYRIDPDTLAATPLSDLDTGRPPYYYSKESLLENNIICALSTAVDAIESDDLGEGVRARMMLQNLLALLQTARTDSSRIKLLLELVGKMTCRPAAILQLDRRGSIAEGYYADIVLFNREMSGIDSVFVNGCPALRGGMVTGIKAGRHLARHPRP